MPEGLPVTISVEDVAELLGISARSAYRAARSGELPALRLGRRVLVPTARLLELIGEDASTALRAVLSKTQAAPA